MGATIDPQLTHGWGIRPADWSYSASIQQELFPKASIEIGYYRRTFTMFTFVKRLNATTVTPTL